jgi:hypothetical protein
MEVFLGLTIRVWGTCPRSVSRVLCVMSGGDLELGRPEMPSSGIPGWLEKIVSDIEIELQNISEGPA